jgi:uncharacterized protein
VSRSELTVWSRDGLALEAVVDLQNEPKGVVVLCHPHPKMGGTMSAPLLVAVADGLVDRGWGVLRFNFRGVGASEGQPSTGVDEVGDAEGALDWVRERWRGAKVAIAGWSFGAAVAVRVAAGDRSLLGCVAIAPAVTRKAGVTEGLPEPEVVTIETPLLMICAANDHLVDLEDARAWAARVPCARVEVLEGANHFFWARYDSVAASAADFLDGLG